MAAGSMMKDYVRRQLRYWVDGFKDDMLPRDFMAKSHTKTQLMLPEINLKPQRVASVLHLPSPLLVTSVQCIELTIAVPSWTDADKEAAHKPVLVHANELLVQVRNLWECSSKVRRAAEERVQAALLEPDPLGSTVAMFEFARDVNDRTKLVVDKLRVQVFVGDVCRVELVLADLNARTTDALWQDVKDPTACVDYSPDHLVQTRFKAMSFILSVGITPAGADATATRGSQPIRLMTKVAVVIRVTRFYHRKEIADSWRRQMQLVEVNFGAVKVELGIAELMELYSVGATLCNWIWNGRSSEDCALSAPVDGMAADREPPGAGGADHPNIELQITFRGTIEAKLKFTSPTAGPQELFLVADRAAGNIIFHKHGVRELQMSLHELAVRFRGYVVFRLKPDREVFHVEQRLNSLSVTWRVQSVLCRVDDDLAVVLMEMHQFVSEKEQAIVLRCGTCHQQISLDMIDVHVCPPRNGSTSLPSTPHAGHTALQESGRNRFSEASSAENSCFGAEQVVCANGPPKVHAVLHMDELELQTGSRLVQILLKLFGVTEAEGAVGRDVTTKLSNLRLTTESNEFAGDAIFVPALPLAFQMLECSLQGCGCILRRNEITSHQDSSQAIVYGYRWPARVFLDIAHCSMSAQECFVKVDKIQLRSSFSDGSRVCSSSQPQLSFHVNMDKIRSRLDEVLFKVALQVFEHFGGSSSRAGNSMMMTLFLGVLQIRAVEFTLQNEGVAEARAKSLLKQAIVVFDNQRGFLCTQSSLDFKTILTSQTMKFVHRQTPVVRTHFESLVPLNSSEISIPEETATQNDTPDATTDIEPTPVSEESAIVGQTPTDDIENCASTEAICPEKDENTPTTTPITPPELEREDASRCIQRMVRRQYLVRQQKQRFEADDYEPGVLKPIEIIAKQTTEETSKPPLISTTSEDSGGSNSSSPTSSPRKLSLGIPSPIMVLGPDSDLVGEIRGGISKLMSPLSRTRLPSDSSIRGSINRFMGPINRTLSPTGSKARRPSVESVVPIVEVACYNITTSEASAREPASPSLKKSKEVRESHSNAGSRTPSKDKTPADPSSRTDAVSHSQQAVDSKDVSSEKKTEMPKQNGLSEAKLAALPDVVRVLVQVGECRLCVPINPREKVEYLCREIVRRFNESFAADRGSISAVSLQDKHGGVFSPSDTVAFMLTIAPSELLFAYPHEHDGHIRSLARLAAGSSRTVRSRALQDPSLPKGTTTGEGEKRIRCSKLPLPLVIALLANESERDLIRSGFCERASEAIGEAWPDLALNAASLDAEKNSLIVEVAWHETCIEVTNGDAFALCRQLLGLCTSRATSKYVGKILRGRLKVDSSNPLIEWACRRRLPVSMEKEVHDTSCAQASDQEQVMIATYEQLKKAVQDTYGVYTR
ncbi:hypothetical protein PHYPSEUDO_015049 [Phytophthora pseudosyringae]|uniref:Uncharacterized protein n=1 Tax=Phytophthora pseudosyringae TaxID=221518 RepID=A0A8T1WHJ3_9STRA|nr:hypothetical protein PHYPSEUDO_015049 [Phytophthora pseudosyringae]